MLRVKSVVKYVYVYLCMYMYTYIKCLHMHVQKESDDKLCNSFFLDCSIRVYVKILANARA